MEHLVKFNDNQMQVITRSIDLAEDLVSNYYKMSVNQWLQAKYEVKTLAELTGDEVVDGPFAQVIKYVGRKKDSFLTSSHFDYYKICVQDHSILSQLDKTPHLKLFPFALYIIIHELIHIVRFSRFFHSFEATNKEKLREEALVHSRTTEILSPHNIEGVADVLTFYNSWKGETV